MTSVTHVGLIIHSSTMHQAIFNIDKTSTRVPYFHSLNFLQMFLY